ncbi:BON domain-containing protein [Mucilaginibacter litoreus]|uniref:BON domain-containing protein n=1 Tax=Mucilaginibacter litoreus TaxID=1048221 RepID=A0ABW3AWG2_9SPHI
MKQLRLKKPTGLMLFIGLLFFATACNHQPKDEDIQASVTKQLQDNPDFQDITASVKDGVLTLEGKCQSQNCDSLVESQVKSVDGVKSIENNIEKDDTTDLTLRTSVQDIISKYDGVQADVAAGVVVLRGSIDKKLVQPLMNELQMLNPKKLDNQLVLK